MRYGGQTAWQMPAPTRIFTPAVTTLLLLMVGSYLAGSLWPRAVGRWLGLDPGPVLRGAVWTLWTYPLVSRDLGSLLMQGLMLLMLGSAVERQVRTGPFLLLWTITALGVGLAWLVAAGLFAGGAVLTGAQGQVFGLLAALGVLMRGRRLMVLLAVVEARTLVWILIGIGALMCLRSPVRLVLVLGAPLALATLRLADWRQRRDSDNPGGGFQAGSFVDVD